MKKIKVGLLPLYIKLYDDSISYLRPKVDAFHGLISRLLGESGLEVVDVPVCRIKPEFEAAIAKFEAEDCDAMITLNLAYSPSLEASDAIARTKLPVIVLDTTPDYVYKPSTDPEALNYNHGIHGVQDLCNLMRRNGKPYVIVAGHWEKSDVIERAAKAAQAALLAKTISTARVGMVGDPFEGMGDFGLSPAEFRERIGFEVVKYGEDDVCDIPDGDIDAEYDADRAACAVNNVDRELYHDVEKVGMSIRRWVERENLTGFTMNFLASKAGTYFNKMPFAEASKAMRDGIGYAGEGDVMTAALVGSLLKVFPHTSFCEMFCPDWEGDTVFLNHMGEFNMACSTGDLTLDHVPFGYTDAGDTFSIIGSFMPGKTIFTCIAPQKDGKFTLIAAKGKMLKLGRDEENRQACGINGWFKPKLPIADFLEAYSRAGGIHHAAMIWDGDLETLSRFAAYMGWDFVSIK